MKLYEILDTEQQLDEGLKQSLAALVMAALMSTVAYGKPVDAAVDKMSDSEKATLVQSLGAATKDAGFQDMLKQAASSKPAEVKKAVADPAFLKKFAQELEQAASDMDDMTTKAGDRISQAAKSGSDKQRAALRQHGQELQKMIAAD